jgi:hypothetical protein
MDRATLYDEDILLWAEQQADVLRRLALTPERVPNDLDLENVIEEIESVGREQLYSVESRLRLILTHLIKLASEPESQAASHWDSEIMNWQGDLLSRFAPSMARRLDMDRIWKRAVREASPKAAKRRPDRTLVCPFTLDEILDEEFATEPLVSRLLALRDKDPSNVIHE